MIDSGPKVGKVKYVTLQVYWFYSQQVTVDNDIKLHKQVSALVESKNSFNWIIYHNQ